MNRFALALLLLAVALTQLPLLPHGYGTDPDAWRVASSASTLWSTGHYEVSRYPGYPLHEIISAPLVGTGGAFASNSATLIAALLLLIVWNITVLREARHPALLVFTFAFTPLFLKNSAVTMDYVWSLLFLILAFRAALKSRLAPAASHAGVSDLTHATGFPVRVTLDRALLAGVFVGVAAGFRLSNFVAVIPLAFLFLHQTNPRREILLFTLTALGTCLLAYLPPLTTLGPAAWYAGTAAQLDDVRQHQVLDFRVFAYRSIYAFGPLATAAALCFAVTKWKEIRQNFRSYDPIVWSGLAAIGIFGGMFLLLPVEREYLLPLLPFLLLLADRFFTRSQLVVLSLFVISFAFINPDIIAHEGAAGQLHPSLRHGMLLEDREKRLGIEGSKERICALSLPGKALVMTALPGPFWFREEKVERVASPFHEQLLRNRRTAGAFHILALSQEEVKTARTLGFEVFALERARWYIEQSGGYNLEAAGVRSVSLPELLPPCPIYDFGTSP